MSVVSIATPFNIELEFTVATFARRASAWLIDGVVMLLYRLAYGFAVYDYLPDNEAVRIIIISLTLGLPLALYHFLMEVFFHGQSIGKKLLGIRVVNFMGNEASISQYLIRLLFRSYYLVPLVTVIVLSLFYDMLGVQNDSIWIVAVLVLLMAALSMFMYFVLSKYGQRVGDKLANTLVIEDQAKADFHKTIYLEIADEAYQVQYPQVMKLTDRDINGIRNLLDVKRITKEHEAYMMRISNRIIEVLGITTKQAPYEFLAQLLRDYNFLTSK